MDSVQYTHELGDDPPSKTVGEGQLVHEDELPSKQEEQLEEQILHTPEST